MTGWEALCESVCTQLRTAAYLDMRCNGDDNDDNNKA